MNTPSSTKTPLTDALDRYQDGEGGLYPHSDGNWVSIEDVRQLELKNQELEAEIEQLKSSRNYLELLASRARIPELIAQSNDLHAACLEYKKQALESWNKEQSAIKERDALKLAGDELAEQLNHHKLDENWNKYDFEAIHNWQSLTTTKKENEG